MEDSGGLTGEASLNVPVKDENDNSPECTETAAVVSVDEGSAAGVIYNIHCSDKVASLA